MARPPRHASTARNLPRYRRAFMTTCRSHPGHLLLAPVLTHLDPSWLSPSAVAAGVWQYLVVPNALDASLLGRLTDVADRVAAAVLEETPKKFHVATRGWDVAKRKWAGDIGVCVRARVAPRGSPSPPPPHTHTPHTTTHTDKTENPS